MIKLLVVILSLAILSMKSSSLRRSYRLFSLVESKFTTKAVIDDMKQKLTIKPSSTLIKNTQKTINIDAQKIEQQVNEIKKILNVADFDVDVWFCSERKIRELNDEWRGKRKSTDVLSFPACDFTAPGKIVNDPMFEHLKHLGDIAIAPLYVQRQCIKDSKLYDKNREEYLAETDAGVSKAMSTVFDVNKRISYLIIHGMIHLLGYDHETEKQWKQMTNKENEVLDKIKSLQIFE